MLKSRVGGQQSIVETHFARIKNAPVQVGRITWPPMLVLLIEEVHTVARKILFTSLLVSTLLLLPVLTWACDGAGPSTHIGTVQSVDASSKTFTIIDAQTRMPIKFMASNEIIDGLKDAKGSVMVNYEEMESGDGLKAVGVTF